LRLCVFAFQRFCQPEKDEGRGRCPGLLSSVFCPPTYRRSSPRSRPPPRRESPLLRRDSPPRDRLEADPREERTLALRLLREGADSDDRLGAEERERGVARDGADSRPLDRLRLGADCRLGAASREMIAPRDGADERVLLERDGADDRSRLELERTFRSRGMATDERLLPEREFLSDDEREDERPLEIVDERSDPREREASAARDDDRLRSDSVKRSERALDDRLDEPDARDSDRAEARLVIVRPLSRR